MKEDRSGSTREIKRKYFGYYSGKSGFKGKGNLREWIERIEDEFKGKGKPERMDREN